MPIRKRQLPDNLPPRLLNLEQAAAYCGISSPLLVRDVPVAPVRIGARKLWDRRALDRWLDGLSGLAQPLASNDAILRLFDADAP